jgi:hypothetical protein
MDTADVIALIAVVMSFGRHPPNPYLDIDEYGRRL